MNLRPALGAALAAATLLAACAGGGDDSAADVEPSEAATSTELAGTTPGTGSADGAGAEPAVLRVPDDHATIQGAVDAAAPGDLVLIEPGVYTEAVDVSTDALTIRGLDRLGVVLDGEFELENGIRVLGADGVAIENLTARNYTASGIFWVGADGFRGSYLNAQRNRDYGIYAFDSVNGVIEHSYASGNPDGGLYVGQCFPCNTLVDGMWAEHNGYGYLGTNSGGDLTIVNSQFNDNRVGVMPNSGTYELCYPGRETTIVGNVVVGNDNPDTPATSNVGFGTGIVLAGTHRNVVERNLVDDHERYGIAIRPFFEPNPNDDLPDQGEWDVPCSEQRDAPLADVDPDELANGVFLVWDAFDNRVVGNRITGSGIADLVTAGFDVEARELRNCFAANEFTTSQPAALEQLAPCDGTGAGDWSVDAADATEIAEFAGPGAVDYRDLELPPIPDLPGLADPESAPANPAVDATWTIDVDEITLPETALFQDPN